MKIYDSTFTPRPMLEIADIAERQGFRVWGVDGGIRNCGLAQYRCSLDGENTRIFSGAYGVTPSYAQERASRRRSEIRKHNKQFGGMFSDVALGGGNVSDGFDATIHTGPAAQMLLDEIHKRWVTQSGKYPAIICMEYSTPDVVEAVNTLICRHRDKQVASGVQWTFTVTVPEAKEAATGDTGATKKEVQKHFQELADIAAGTRGQPEMVNFKDMDSYDETDACAVAIACADKLRWMFRSVLGGTGCHIHDVWDAFRVDGGRLRNC